MSTANCRRLENEKEFTTSGTVSLDSQGNRGAGYMLLLYFSNFKNKILPEKR